ncbi:MAG: alkane 1-monooxygenase [Proteobacteria bacterium]|nr:alkane 1-monooxygenase [Pseudomonadota bacterium]
MSVGMKTYAYLLPDGQPATYSDRWRWRWSLSVLLPLLPVLAIGLTEASGHSAWLWMPLGVMYLVIPALDWLIGEDRSNPPEAVVPELEREPFYRWLTYAAVPIHLGVLVGGFWYAMARAEGPVEVLPLVLSLGFVGALAINVGHELGHKRSEPERTLALVALSITGYGHFRIEHNLGHHAQVATPEDSASARMGESVYRFVRREVPGALSRSWRLEAARLRREGHGAFSLHNEILQGLAMTLAVQAALVAWLGWKALPWLLLHNLWGWWQLTGVNYIEHYGLLRRKRPDGSYERVLPRHSWNSNHLVSNVLLFHLQRHSDHHAHAERHFQSLRHCGEAPQLPTGYMGMLLLSFFPRLYFRVMDPRLLAQADGNLERINLEPRVRGRLERRYATGVSSPK